MRFNLRRQLLIIGLLVLILPWASIGYVRQTENALRQTQFDLLERLAQGMQEDLSAAIAPRFHDASNDAIYLHKLEQTPLLDGYLSDWQLDAALRPAQLNAPLLQTQVAKAGEIIWLYASINAVGDTPPVFELTCQSDQQAFNSVNLSPQAPGPFSSKLSGDPNNAELRGVWQESAGRSQLELRIPAGRCEQRLGLSVEIGTHRAATFVDSLPGQTISEAEPINDRLASAPLAGIQRYVVDRRGWRISEVAGRIATREGAQEQTGLGARLYRFLLREQLATDAFDPSDPLTRHDYVRDALNGQVGQTRLHMAASDGTDPILLSAVALPLTRGGERVGALILQQDSAAILTLTNNALVRLTNTVIALSFLLVAVLLGWATWLSWRIRKLAAATSQALSRDGQLTVEMPGSEAHDEIGGLSRSFRSLLLQVREQQSWLRTMADKLSHELRTPIAVVQSSLENLNHSGLSESQAVLSTRASEGVERLQKILNAMSSANRAEQAASNAELVAMDLSSFMQQLQLAYASTFEQHVINAEIESDVYIQGAAELLVQMIDKLVQNAAEFAPQASTITLRLSRTESGARVSVMNTGPSLPSDDYEPLFHSFVSHRADDHDGAHLGFGLYIARLIAEAHDARISANNSADGVEMHVDFEQVAITTTR